MSTNNNKKAEKSINWPENGKHFTIDEIFALNPNDKPVTLRVRTTTAIKDGLVSVIGSKNFGKGRPKMILSMNPVSKETLEKAHQDGVQPTDTTPTQVIPVVSISTTQSPVDIKITTPIPTSTEIISA